MEFLYCDKCLNNDWEVIEESNISILAKCSWCGNIDTFKNDTPFNEDDDSSN